jgi:pimeloyl-ACP methyl ester carboxylesterase
MRPSKFDKLGRSCCVNTPFFPLSLHVIFLSHIFRVITHSHPHEGTGPVILFSHGTPEWSFGWRDLIKGLRGHFRCVAPDLLGMGLSEKPVCVVAKPEEEIRPPGSIDCKRTHCPDVLRFKAQHDICCRHSVLL